jgi:glycosyltransferase involved in cell wall biosynthesis
VLAAPAELRARGVAVEVDMYGGGSLLDAHRDLARELGIDDVVQFHGAVPADELERGVAIADVCISASSSDGTSLALLETMALGTPALCVRIAATEGWIDEGVTGLLCDDDAASMADAVERLRATDVEALRAAASAQVAERADRDVCLGRIERLYRALAAGDARRGVPGAHGGASAGAPRDRAGRAA